jgi:hypothetical protein
MADRNRGRRKPGRGRESGRDDRALADRAQDEVRSWFGDERAARRRHRDVMARGQRDPVARGGQAPLGMAYGEGGRGRPRQSAPSRPYDRPVDSPEHMEAGTPRQREYDRSGAADRGWDEPSYGYRPGAGYDYGADPRAEPGWDARSVSGYGVQWRGRPDHYGPYAGRGPKGYQRSDARVLEEACDRLADAPDVDASEIEVEVHEGEVTLSGTVHDRWQKRRAEDVIDRVSGVREVHNRLRVVRTET